MLSKTLPSVYQSPKCFVTHGSMGHLDTKQVPHKNKPWSNIARLQALHRVDILLPMDIPDAVRRKLQDEIPSPFHFRVIMSLEQVLEREFVTNVIKQGTVQMLSEGKTTTQNTFIICKGTLTMHLDKETYDKAGLIGQPQGVKGNRGLRTRWIVQYDLQTPSMRHGKKGFDRLVFAAKNVLNKPLTWLVCGMDDSGSDMVPLHKHFPAKFTSAPSEIELVEAQQASSTRSGDVMPTSQKMEMEIEATELYEWISLVRLGSPRVKDAEVVDPYISRYWPPQTSSGPAMLGRISWQGFISPQWLHQTMASLLSTCPSKEWFALSACEFSASAASTSNEVLLLRPANAADEYIMWEVKHGE